MLEDGPIQLRHHGGVLAQREAHVVGVLLRHDTQLVEPGRLGFGEGSIPDVGQSRTTPQAERFSQRLGRRSRVIPQPLGAGPLLEAGEPTDVGLIRHDRQSVTGRHPLDQLDLADLAQCLPDTVDVDLEGAQGVARRLLSPQPVHQTIGGDHVRCAQGEHREHDPLTRRPQGDVPIPLGRLQRTEQPELHGARLVAPARTEVFHAFSVWSAGLGVPAHQQACSVSGFTGEVEPMSPFARYVVATVLGASLLAPAGASQSAPLVDCDALPGLIPNVWTGLGVDPDADDQWENDANWSLGIAPLRLSDPYVCIPAGGTPVIGAGQEAQLVALDVAAGGELTVETGGKLFLYGGSLTPSTIRGRVDVVGATFGGPGRVDVSGSLNMRSLGPSAPATITTRECATRTVPSRASHHRGHLGRIVVEDEGVVDVSGGRVNLADQFRITVHGLLRVHDDGFLAADHGTRLELLPHSGPTAGTGTLRFEDDGDYVEGSNDVGIAELGAVVNQGLIIKSGGSGTSLVTGTYSQPSPGAVTVDSGTLLLPSGSPTPATVASGGGYGSGRCLAPAQPGCLAQTFALDRQNAQFQVPTEDSTGASVVIQRVRHQVLGS